MAVATQAVPIYEVFRVPKDKAHVLRDFNRDRLDTICCLHRNQWAQGFHALEEVMQTLEPAFNEGARDDARIGRDYRKRALKSLIDSLEIRDGKGIFNRLKIDRNFTLTRNEELSSEARQIPERPYIVTREGVKVYQEPPPAVAVESVGQLAHRPQHPVVGTEAAYRENKVDPIARVQIRFDSMRADAERAAQELRELAPMAPDAARKGERLDAAKMLDRHALWLAEKRTKI